VGEFKSTKNLRIPCSFKFVVVLMYKHREDISPLGVLCFDGCSELDRRINHSKAIFMLGPQAFQYRSRL